MSTFSIVDPSTKFHTSPVVVNIFSHEDIRFPGVYKLGDILRFHRAKKKNINNKTVLTTYGEGPETSYVVFRRNVDPLSGFPVVYSDVPPDAVENGVQRPSEENDNVSGLPCIDRFGRIDIVSGDKQIALPNLHEEEWSFQSNSRHITFTPHDADVVKNLYNWGMQSLYIYSLHDTHTPLSTFREVSESNSSGAIVSKFDTVCLVLSPPTRHISAQPSGTYLLKVWDCSLKSTDDSPVLGPRDYGWLAIRADKWSPGWTLLSRKRQIGGRNLLQRCKVIK